VVGDALRVEEHQEGRARLRQPRACVRHGAERNRHNSDSQAFEVIDVLAQLCHVLAAGQSTQMPQKDEQPRIPAAPNVGQGNPLPVNRH